MNGKGSKSRIKNYKEFNKNFDAIFWGGKEKKCPQCGSFKIEDGPPNLGGQWCRNPKCDWSTV